MVVVMVVVVLRVCGSFTISPASRLMLLFFKDGVSSVQDGGKISQVGVAIEI